MPDDAYYALNENATPPPGWKPKRPPRDPRKSRLAKWWWLILVFVVIFLGAVASLLVDIFRN